MTPQIAQEAMSLSWLWSHIVSDFSNLGSWSALQAFMTVVLLDIALAGDNAIIVGALAAGLPTDQRKKVIAIGILAALLLRIVFAVLVLYGLERFKEYGLVLAGGLLLLWVAWKMYREIRHTGESPGSAEIEGDEHSGVRPAKSFASAAWAVAVADVSMSLDNVLAVAGAAREHPGIMVIGLILAVALMGVAANIIARYIERYRWIAWVGLVIILYVAGKMIYEGWHDLQPTLTAMA
ncbi:YjbE family putative metal transport protein [Sphingomonas sp. ID1715]|uniref:YjbE family putative metal transport protein n=1 Tax=Sphingomonas sp. ID1715 TaxID=1656898 RepID=UPI001489FC8D|nr:YjbE family putative metal transport protein [Sphingomonas sp. ID1715]NNM77290.1 YjbE family putative metal transport protein [Sphingomonas sp. ID1715]